MKDLTVFDNTTKKTYEWLKEINEEMHWDDRHKAYLALRGCLHALRDRLTVEEAADLGAQLPMLIRGLYYEGWRPAGKPQKELRQKEDFLQAIQQVFVNEPDLDAEPVAKGVFRVMAKRVTEGEIQDVKSLMPKELVSLWPATANV